MNVTGTELFANERNENNEHMSAVSEKFKDKKANEMSIK